MKFSGLAHEFIKEGDWIGVAAVAVRLFAKWLEEHESSEGGISPITRVTNELSQLRAENARLTEFVETLAATPCEKYTSGDCQENGRTATAKYAAFRMCYPCQAAQAKKENDTWNKLK